MRGTDSPVSEPGRAGAASSNRREEWLARAAGAQRAVEQVLVGLVVVYSIFAVLNGLRLPWPKALWVVAANFLLALAFGAARRLVGSGRWPREFDEPAVAVAFVVAQANTLHTGWHFDKPLQLVFVGLALVALACFSASDRWYTIGTAVMVGEWLAVRLAASGSGTRLREELFYVVGAVALALVVYRSRLTGLIRLGASLAEVERQRALMVSVLNGANDLIQTVGPEGRIAFVNEAWGRALGVEPSAAVGRHIADFVIPEDREQIVEILKGTGELPGSIETTLLASGGEPVYVAGRIQLREDGGTRGYLRNRTVERRLRSDLAEQETMLRDFAQASGQVFWIFDLASERFVFVNDAFLALTGREPRTLLADPEVFFELFPAEDLERIKDLILRVRAGEALRVDHALVHRDGSQRWVHLHTFPLVGADGRVERVAGVSLDLTERRRLETELAAANLRLAARERLLEQFVHSSPVAVAMFDSSGRYLAVSDRWLAVHGLEGREVLGEPLPQTLPALAEQWGELLAAGRRGEAVHHEELALDRNGRVEWYRCELQPWVGGSGELGFLLFTEVVTEAKIAREGLQRLAFVDVLTGAANRRGVERALGRLWERAGRSDRSFGLIFLDLDKFKPVNDRLGHGAGDDVLVEVVTRLRDASRPADVVPGLVWVGPLARAVGACHPKR